LTPAWVIMPNAIDDDDDVRQPVIDEDVSLELNHLHSTVERIADSMISWAL
jgi:hypothetical protein